MSVKSFDWVPFYMELADQLLPYQNNRQELIEKVRQIYAMTGIGMPTLEQDDHIDDLERNQVINAVTALLMQAVGILIEAGIEHQNGIAALMCFLGEFRDAFKHLRIVNPRCAKRKNQTVIQHRIPPFFRQFM